MVFKQQMCLSIYSEQNDLILDADCYSLCSDAKIRLTIETLSISAYGKISALLAKQKRL